MRALHKGEGYLICPLCNKSGFTKDGLDMHTEKMHKNELLPAHIKRLFEPYAEPLPPAFLFRGYVPKTTK